MRYKLDDSDASGKGYHSFLNTGLVFTLIQPFGSVLDAVV